LAVAFFLFANIKVTNAGVGYGYLLIAFGCLIVVALFRRDPFRSIALRPSAAALLAFMAYFFVRLMIDVGDPDRLKALTVGTSGGVVFALLLGISVSLFMCGLYESQVKTHWRLFAVVLFLIVCTSLSLDTYRAHIANVRADIFLVADNSSYQRPGNFVIMLGLIASTLLAQSMELPKRGKLQNIAAVVAVGMYFALLLVLLITSQLIGSNTGLVVTAFVGVGTLSWIWRPRLKKWKYHALFLGNKLTVLSLIRKSARKLIANVIIAAGVTAALGVTLLSVMHLNLEEFRIVGYSSGTIGGHSLESRIRILRSNFLTQFAYAPLFGNLNADSLTTGAGTYAHSLISMLSHLGIVGSLLFVIYLVAICREQFRGNVHIARYYGSLDMTLLRAIMAVVIVGFALVGTFFTWMPLWFSLGFLFPPIVFRRWFCAPRS
jgi:hypothetical protein